MPATLNDWLHDRDLNVPPSSSPASSVQDEERPTKRIRISVANAADAVRRFERGRRLCQLESQKSKRMKQTIMTRAKLRLLPSLPLDILHEIFSHVLPLDLLHIARTSKSLRDLLMHRSATSTWKAALRNVPGNFPDCPPELVEPQFANLAFDSHCNSCLTKNVPLQNVYWELRLRLCSKCSKTMLWCDDGIEFTEEMRYCIPTTYRNPSTYCLRKDEDELVKTLATFDESAADRATFCQRKRDEMKLLTEHGSLCEAWVEETMEAREAAREQIKNERRTFIESKLWDLGYDWVLIDMPTDHTIRTRGLVLFRDHPLVKLPKPLTERSWLNIESRMVEWAEEMQSHMLEEKRFEEIKRRQLFALEVLRTYKAANPSSGDLPLPTPVDFCAWGPVKAILEADTEASITVASFDTVIPRIALYFAEWRAFIVSAAAENIPRYYGSPRSFKSWTEDREHALQLATTVFVCGGPYGLHAPECVLNSDPLTARDETYEGMWYPHFMHHGCLQIASVDFTEEDRKWDMPATRLGSGFSRHVRRRKWDAKRLLFDDRASAVVAQIVRACGLDPNEATATEMDEMDPRLVCLKCSYGHRCDGERIVVVRSWRSSAQHCMKAHWGDGTVTWEKIAAEDADKARKHEVAEAAYRKKMGVKRPKEAVWKCARCRDTDHEPNRMFKRDFKKHLSRTHDIDDPEESDWCRSEDAVPRPPVTVKMAPRATA